MIVSIQSRRARRPSLACSRHACEAPTRDQAGTTRQLEKQSRLAPEAIHAYPFRCGPREEGRTGVLLIDVATPTEIVRRLRSKLGQFLNPKFLDRKSPQIVKEQDSVCWRRTRPVKLQDPILFGLKGLAADDIQGREPPAA
jgi:hypothetical protein